MILQKRAVEGCIIPWRNLQDVVKKSKVHFPFKLWVKNCMQTAESYQLRVFVEKSRVSYNRASTQSEFTCVDWQH